jgi:predicted MPP superfamily phosphohydrolase
LKEYTDFQRRKRHICGTQWTNKTEKTQWTDSNRLTNGSEYWGFKIEGWWHTGNIRVKKTKKVFECWVRNKEKAPSDAQESIITVLLTPNHNFGKDEYVVDLAGHEARYWQGTESGLLGDFEFQGA